MRNFVSKATTVLFALVVISLFASVASAENITINTSADVLKVVDPSTVWENGDGGVGGKTVKACVVGAGVTLWAEHDSPEETGALIPEGINIYVISKPSSSDQSDNPETDDTTPNPVSNLTELRANLQESTIVRNNDGGLGGNLSHQIIISGDTEGRLAIRLLCGSDATRQLGEVISKDSFVYAWNVEFPAVSSDLDIEEFAPRPTSLQEFLEYGEVQEVMSDGTLLQLTRHVWFSEEAALNLQVLRGSDDPLPAETALRAGDVIFIRELETGVEVTEIKYAELGLYGSVGYTELPIWVKFMAAENVQLTSADATIRDTVTTTGKTGIRKDGVILEGETVYVAPTATLQTYKPADFDGLSVIGVARKYDEVKPEGIAHERWLVKLYTNWEIQAGYSVQYNSDEFLPAGTVIPQEAEAMFTIKGTSASTTGGGTVGSHGGGAGGGGCSNGWNSLGMALVAVFFVGKAKKAC